MLELIFSRYFIFCFLNLDAIAVLAALAAPEAHFHVAYFETKLLRNQPYWLLSLSCYFFFFSPTQSPQDTRSVRSL